MKNFISILQIVAKPITVLVALWWFGAEFKKILKAISDYIERLRTFKGTFGSASVEADTEKLEEIQQRIEASSPPIPEPSQREVPDILEARKFILRDTSGVARAELSATEGMVSLVLFDANSKTRVTIAALADFSYFSVDAPNGQRSSVVNSNEQNAYFCTVEAGHVTSFLDKEAICVVGKFLAPAP